MLITAQNMQMSSVTAVQNKETQVNELLDLERSPAQAKALSGEKG